ncbi:MAG: porin, partial [Bacteroidia bacterium]
HIVSRLTYPFKFKNGQYFETSLQAYQGRVGITKTKGNNAPDEFFERRAAASLIVYPQPFGVQAEYTIGVGPEFNTTTMRTENANLKGGYIQLMYYAKAGAQLIIPFVRTQYYNGGKKHEIDARKYRVTEHEIGIEWQPISNFEFVAMYTISNRTFEDYATPLNNQKGNLLRLQAQCNF